MDVSPMPWDDRIKRRLKLRDLDVLMAVVTAGGMGKAAAKLNVSQPAISKAIADLEQTLGVRLVDRSRRGAEPTPYGLALIKRGAAVFDELRQGMNDIDYLADPTTGELRIGVVEGVASAIVAPLMARLSRKYPRMTFSVDVAGTAKLCADLSQRRIELAIAKTDGELPEDQHGETLFHDAMVVVSGVSNPLARRRTLTLADLSEEPWTLEPPGTFIGSLSAMAFSGAGLQPPKATIVTNSRNLQNALMETGHFLALQPEFVLRLPRKHRTLKALPVSLPHTRRPVQIITPKYRSLSPLAVFFIEQVREMSIPYAKASGR
jgi:DNA-binding transcriptional LysR family regulator